MSNHDRTVVFVDANRAREWNEITVIQHWKKLFRIPALVDRYRRGEGSEAEHDVARQLIAKWRSRLLDMSWFMRCLNEYLARRANAEDQCTGRFWAGESSYNAGISYVHVGQKRFKSQALLDEAGLLTAMAYVDLNPIRAGIAATPEASEFTSIYERIQSIRDKKTNGPQLRRFHTQGSKSFTLPYAIEDYLHLVDWTGRAMRNDKRGHIDNRLPPLLTRLNIDSAAWTQAMQPDGNVFGRAMGKLNHLHLHARTLGQSWMKVLRQAERLYGSRQSIDRH